MSQQYFVLEFGHSVHGRVKRVHISYKALGYTALVLGIVALITLGLFSSYVSMSWKASKYNQLAADFERLRTRYQDLQKISKQHKEQIASLESLASEVSAAYGIKGQLPEGLPPEGSVKESLQQYNFLKAASVAGIYHRYAYDWHRNSEPSLWPVNGALRSPFGGRSDPFSGEGTFHTGVDLVATNGTPVHVTADGVIASAAWSGSYGKLVVVDHGNGIETYYAHLSQFMVVPGEEVQRGQVIALSGGTGRATGPHMHYEVRVGGTPVNPYKYLAKSQPPDTKPEHSDLGL